LVNFFSQTHLVTLFRDTDQTCADANVSKRRLAPRFQFEPKNRTRITFLAREEKKHKTQKTSAARKNNSLKFGQKLAIFFTGEKFFFFVLFSQSSDFDHVPLRHLRRPQPAGPAAVGCLHLDKNTGSNPARK
jgi:hypothetical protein